MWHTIDVDISTQTSTSLGDVDVSRRRRRLHTDVDVPRRRRRLHTDVDVSRRRRRLHTDVDVSWRRRRLHTDVDVCAETSTSPGDVDVSAQTSTSPTDVDVSNERRRLRGCILLLMACHTPARMHYRFKPGQEPTTVNPKIFVSKNFRVGNFRFQKFSDASVRPKIKNTDNF